jgi:Polysaccharide biosynthesis protein
MDKGMLKNVAINFFGLILPTFVSLVTVPTYIRLLGVERYGVVSLVWTFIGYFGVLDLGMGMAAQNQISKARAASDGAQGALVFWSAFWLNLATGVVGGLLLYIGGYLYTTHFTHAVPAMREELYGALPWLALAIPVANVSWVCAGAINGAERFGVYNWNQAFGTFLFQLLPLGAAWLIAPTLPTVLAAAVLARGIAAVLLARAGRRVLGIDRVSMPRIRVAKDLFRFGGSMLVASMTIMVGDTLDRVLLGAGLGQAGVTRLLIQSHINPARVAWIGIIELPFFAGVLMLGITRFGLIGAAAAVVARSIVDYGVLLYLSSIRARPIVLDMLGHLAFLVASTYLAQAATHLAALAMLGAGLICANVAWSFSTSSSLRGIARALLLRVNTRRSA